MHVDLDPNLDVVLLFETKYFLFDSEDVVF